MKERRYLPIRELRTETKDGERFITFLAAPYNSLSEDMGGWNERIRNGAFSRMLREKQDVRHLVNHDENRILGRVGAGTTELWEDSAGLHGRTRVGKRSYELDLLESIDRGDIAHCSFAFLNAQKPVWVQESDGRGGKRSVRELVDLDVFDVSLVTYPAYTATNAELRSKAIFPEGLPADLAQRQQIDTLVRNFALGVEREQRCQIATLRAARRPELRAITNTAGILEVVIYGRIGFSWWNDDFITVAKLKKAIDSAGAFTSIQVRINSGGGDAFEGIAIYNLLRAQNKPVKVCVDGLAASAASIIAMAGDEVVMGMGSMLMIHDPWTIDIGNAADFRQLADWLDKLAVSGAEIYALRTGQSVDAIRALMTAETWLTAQESVDQGFADSIGAVQDRPAAPEPEPAVEEDGDEPADPEPEEFSRMDLSLVPFYRNAPAALKECATRSQNPTRRVDGEDLPASAFLVVGDASDPKTWKLPVEFRAADKTKKHLRTAQHRLPEMTLTPELRAFAEKRLAALCTANQVEAEPNFAEQANARLRAIQATLD